eukprot:jgi/Botrbrau1/1131/Bobra.0162s0026.2
MYVTNAYPRHMQSIHELGVRLETNGTLPSCATCRPNCLRHPLRMEFSPYPQHHNPFFGRSCNAHRSLVCAATREEHGNVPASKARKKGPDDRYWRVYQVNVQVDKDLGKDDFSITQEVCRALEHRLGCRGTIPPESVRLVRKSFDARTERSRGGPTKRTFTYVLDVEAAAAQKAKARSLKSQYVTRVETEDTQEVRPIWDLNGSADVAAAQGSAREPVVAPIQAKGAPVLVVGCGPAGLFAALAMAVRGVPVVLLERGQPVERRGRDIGALFVRHILNPDSNLCYGEGGAGTWSDGKLTTRIGRNSEPVRFVLQTLVALGAPPEILVAGKPHLGTDRLVRILRSFRERLEGLGVKLLFNSRVEDLIVARGRVLGVKLSGGEEVRGSAVVLATGHSARGMYRRLVQHGAAMTPKPFAAGFRIEHPQALIDRIQYGPVLAADVLRGRGRIPVGDYALAATITGETSGQAPGQDSSHGQPAHGVDIFPEAFHPVACPSSEQGVEALSSREAAEASDTAMRPGERSDAERHVYSFCMCPGGQIVPTSTNPEELCINGMSFSRRDSKWANAAVVCGLGPPDWAHLEAGHGVLAPMELQRLFERRAAQMGGGGFVAPVQSVLDFMDPAGKPPAAAEVPSSSYRLGVRASPLT